MQKYNINDMKSAINNFQTSRRGIIQGTDIFNNMQKLKKTMDSMQPLLKGQEVYIKNNYFISQNSVSQGDRSLEFKRNINRMCEIVKSQFVQMIQIGDSYFHLNRKQRKQNWQKIYSDFQNKINEKKQSVTINSFFPFLFSILNVRDYIYKQFLKSMIYRKYLLWNDLKQVNVQYVHTQVKKIFKQFEQQNDHFGYIPTLIQFNPPSFAQVGKWNIYQNQVQQNDISIPALLKSLNRQYQQILDTVRNYSKLSENPQNFEDLNKNQRIVKNLRQKIEVLSLNYNVLLTKYRQANLKSQQKEDIIGLKNKIQQYENLLAQKEIEINEMRIQFKGSSSIIQSLKEKIKLHQAARLRIQALEISKRKQLQLTQYTLNDEFQKLKKQLGNYALIYKLQNQSKKEIIKDLQSKDVQINNLVQILGRQRRHIKDLKLQISRLNLLILQLSKKLN